MPQKFEEIQRAEYTNVHCRRRVPCRSRSQARCEVSQFLGQAQAQGSVQIMAFKDRGRRASLECEGLSQDSSRDKATFQGMTLAPGSKRPDRD